MRRRQPRATRTYPTYPSPTLLRSHHSEDLEQRDEEQGLRDEGGEDDAGLERRRAPEPHARQREGGRYADHHGDRDDEDRHDRRVAEEDQKQIGRAHV